MKLSKISTEDPILTAYALGELEAGEAARVAAAIEHDILAQQAVNEIRTTAEELQLALKDEPVLAKSSGMKTAAGSPTRAPVVRFPYYLATGAAAAAFIVFFAVRTPVVHNSAVVAAPVAPVNVPAPAALAVSKDGANAPTDQMALAGRLANVIPDGFSDLKPAPFRDAGYRLGKSIVANEQATTSKEAESTKAAVSLEKTNNEFAAEQTAGAENAKINAGSVDAARVMAASYELVPVAAADLPASEDKGAKEQPPHQLLTLKIRYQVPLIDVNRKGNIPLVNAGTLFAFTSKDLNFAAGVTGFGSVLKESPRATTYEDVLSWSAQTEKSDKADKRSELIELVKKPKNATVE